MLFVDYVFDVLENGTIIMDKELDAKKLGVKNGDKYVVNVTFDGRIVFQKVKEENGRNSGTN
jgi:formylmethanofuran dehydrogenase subunit D